MSSPKDLSIEALAEWLDDLLECGDIMGSAFRRTAEAVRALVEAKVREAAYMAQTIDQIGNGPWHFAYGPVDVVARVMGGDA